MKEIDPGLHALQAEVGGDIAASYPFDDPVGLVLNDEGKLIGLDLNRSLRDEHGEIYDIVAGTFLVVGLGSESFASLPPDMIQKYTEQFKRPELFASINGQIVSVPVEPENPLRTAEMTLEDDYGMIDGVLNNGRRGEELEKAQEQVEANFITDAELTYAKGDLAAAKTALDELERILEELEALMTDSEEYQEAKAAVDKWTSEVNTAQTAVETYQSQLDELEKTGEVDMDRRIEDAENALDKARNDWKSDWLAYSSALSSLYDTVKATYSDKMDEMKFTDDKPAEISSTNQIYIEAYLTNHKDNPGKTAYETLLADQNDVDEKEKALDRLEKDHENSDGDYNTQVRKIRKKLNEAEDDLDTAQRELRAAERDLESAEGDNTSLKNQIKDYEAAKRQRAADVETYQNQLSDLCLLYTSDAADEL